MGTADLHQAVEDISDLPGSVTTVQDYGELLSAFHRAHTVIEGALGAEDLVPTWLELGHDMADHRQLGALCDDLAALGVDPDPRAAEVLQLGSPSEALGCLYVVEGSSLGRRVLAPLLKERLGEVPTAFFDGRDGHPHAWRQVQSSIKRATGDPLQPLAILTGARATFEVFLDALGDRAARRHLSCA